MLDLVVHFDLPFTARPAGWRSPRLASGTNMIPIKVQTSLHGTRWKKCQSSFREYAVVDGFGQISQPPAGLDLPRMLAYGIDVTDVLISDHSYWTLPEQWISLKDVCPADIVNSLIPLTLYRDGRPLLSCRPSAFTLEIVFLRDLAETVSADLR